MVRVSGLDENLDISNPCSHRKYVWCPEFSPNPSLKYHITAARSRKSSYICSGDRQRLCSALCFLPLCPSLAHGIGQALSS